MALSEGLLGEAAPGALGSSHQTRRWALGGVLLLVGAILSLASRPDAAMRQTLGPSQAEEPVVFVDGQRYTAVQYLGFNLFTAPGTEADGCFNKGEDLDACYLGSDKVARDVRHRLAIMAEALERAHASENWDRSPGTLKVFLAPEFYWRGAKGAYRISTKFINVSWPVIKEIAGQLSHVRFKHWVFVPGTVVAAQLADQRYVNMSGRTYENISYYNFAPIHIGGTDRKFLKFKHFISSIDFLQTEPNSASRQIAAPPGSAEEFCKKHPESNGCVYGQLPRKLLDEFGYDDFTELRGGVINMGGIRVGFEICLDHAMGTLCNHDLSDDQTVDVQTIVSAGMNIASGPVCTKRNSPAFLADGFARTEMSLNRYGQGRVSADIGGHSRRYNVGITYGADAMVAMQQWIADTIYDLTGTGFGTRFAGLSTLPGGSAGAGETGVKFSQIPALGGDWRAKLNGYYDVASYDEAARAQMALSRDMHQLEKAEQGAIASKIPEPMLFPTLDFYGPLELPNSS